MHVHQAAMRWTVMQLDIVRLKNIINQSNGLA